MADIFLVLPFNALPGWQERSRLADFRSGSVALAYAVTATTQILAMVRVRRRPMRVVAASMNFFERSRLSDRHDVILSNLGDRSAWSLFKSVVFQALRLWYGGLCHQIIG